MVQDVHIPLAGAEKDLHLRTKINLLSVTLAESGQCVL